MCWFHSQRHEVPPPKTRVYLGLAPCRTALLPKSPQETPPVRLPFTLSALSLHLYPGSVHQHLLSGGCTVPNPLDKGSWSKASQSRVAHRIKLANCLSHACRCLPNLPLIRTSNLSFDLWAACLGSVCHFCPPSAMLEPAGPGSQSWWLTVLSSSGNACLCVGISKLATG